MALDYTIYMMMGSFFDKTKAVSTWMEKILRLRYQLLSLKTQYEIEEACERCFEKKILPEGFLKGKASVHWVESKNKKCRNAAAAVSRVRNSSALRKEIQNL